MGVFEAPVLFAGNSFLQNGLRREVEGSCCPARCVAPVYNFLPVGVLCSIPSTVSCYSSSLRLKVNWVSSIHHNGCYIYERGSGADAMCMSYCAILSGLRTGGVLHMHTWLYSSLLSV